MRWAMVFGALLIGLSAWQTTQRADEIDDQVAALEAHTQSIDQQEARALHQGARRVLAAYDVNTIVNDLLDDGVESTRAVRAMTLALNRAVDRANGGDLDGLHEVARNDGGAALAALRRLLAGQVRELAQLDRVLERAQRGDEGGDADA